MPQSGSRKICHRFVDIAANSAICKSTKAAIPHAIADLADLESGTFNVGGI
jgi:hypothetical protein